jgi:uncharacterized membrane protein (UPF0182 family)
VLPFYTFNDVDVDRYVIGDQKLPVMIGPRELDQAQIPDRTWTNQHLVYTHGYGTVAGAANSELDGEPSYLLRDIDPPIGELKEDLTLPGVYFGENVSGYTVVGTKVPEQQAAGEDQTEETRYDGSAGVETSSFIRRASLGLRFWDWNLFVSGQITSSSRVLYKRDIRERVQTAAPFLRYDADPYPVLVDGRLIWVVDAFTTTTKYPYSQVLHPRRLPSGSGLDTEFNYARNSVKATVDAYDGTIKFYIVDEQDPIIKAWAKAFPELFSGVSEMPAGLKEHWRYPEDLFRAQTEQYTLYHMTDPRQFFNKQFLWDVAPDPEALEDVTPTSESGGGSDGGRSNTLAASNNPIAPLYLTMQIPGGTGQEFVLSRPFIPRGKPNQLSSFMMARTDGDNYGKLVSYEVPQNRVVPSPTRAATNIKSEPQISREFTLLGQQRSTVEPGAVQLIPMGNAVVYVQPIYVKGQGRGTYPRLRFVTASLGENAVIADLDPDPDDPDPIPLTSLRDAVIALVTEEIPPPPDEPPPPDGGTDGSTTTTVPPPEGSVAELLAQAAQELALAEEARLAGDLAGYQEHVTRAKQLVDAANGQSGSSTTAPTTTTPTTAAPTETSAPVINASGP